MGSIYSADYDAGYAHICDVDHGGSGTDSTDNHTRQDSIANADSTKIDGVIILRDDVEGAIGGLAIAVISSPFTSGISLGIGLGYFGGAVLSSGWSIVNQG